MLKIIFGVVLGMAALYFVYPYLTSGPVGKITEYPIVECVKCPPPCPGDLKLGTKFSTYWRVIDCEASIDYAIVSYGNNKANNVMLDLKVENPAIAKVRDTKTVSIGNIDVNQEPKFGNEKLHYPCDDDIVKITATVSDSTGRSDVKYFEQKKQ